MEIEIKINFNWYSHVHSEILNSHRQQLEDEAKETIFNLLEKNYTGGELYTTIYDLEYQGSWSVDTKIIK